MARFKQGGNSSYSGLIGWKTRKEAEYLVVDILISEERPERAEGEVKIRKEISWGGGGKPSKG